MDNLGQALPATGPAEAKLLLFFVAIRVILSHSTQSPVRSARNLPDQVKYTGHTNISQALRKMPRRRRTPTPGPRQPHLARGRRRSARDVGISRRESRLHRETGRPHQAVSPGGVNPIIQISNLADASQDPIRADRPTSRSVFRSTINASAFIYATQPAAAECRVFAQDAKSLRPEFGTPCDHNFARGQLTKEVHNNYRQYSNQNKGAQPWVWVRTAYPVSRILNCPMTRFKKS